VRKRGAGFSAPVRKCQGRRGCRFLGRTPRRARQDRHSPTAERRRRGFENPTCPAPLVAGWGFMHQVICGDAVSILPTLANGAVDVVVADIPYGEVNRKTGGLRDLDRKNADTATFDHVWCATQAARIARQSVYIWCGTEQVSGIRSALVDSGMTTRMCVWEKTNPSPMNGESLWLSSIECCVFGRHKLAYFDRFCKSPVWRGPTEPTALHPTTKPLWLMSEIVTASTPVGGTVLDFCCGSGTTGVACARNARNFIGIEIDPGYAEIARRRIAEAAPLFVPPATLQSTPDLFVASAP